MLLDVRCGVTIFCGYVNIILENDNVKVVRVLNNRKITDGSFGYHMKGRTVLNRNKLLYL